MTWAAKIIDDMLAAGITPLLKQRGFRKQRRRYSRKTPAAELLITAQASHSNNDQRARLTFNLGVIVPAVDALMVGIRERAGVTAGVRIGHLLPSQSDFWWELTPDTSIDEVSSSVHNAILNFGLPWLDDLSSLDGLKRRAGEISEGVRYPSLVAASAALLLGEEVVAAAIVEKYVRHPGLPADWARKWATANGVAVA